MTCVRSASSRSGRRRPAAVAWTSSASEIPTDPLPDIAPDARRRRLTALVNASVVAREEPAVYVIEDAHWIDATSESLLADFLLGRPAGRRRWS